MSSIKNVDTNYQDIFGKTRLVPWLAACGMARITDDTRFDISRNIPFN